MELKDSKLLQLLDTFKDKELNKFLKFVKSPYVTELPELSLCGELIIESMILGKLQKLSKPEIFKRVYGEVDFDDLKLRHLFSDLLRLAEKFLAFEKLEAHEVFTGLEVLEAYRERTLNKHFIRQLESLRHQLSKSDIRDSDHYYFTHLLEAEYNEYLSVLYKRQGENNVQKTAENFDIYFIIKKLKYGCMKLNFQNVFDKDYDLFLLEEIIDHVRRTNYQHVPAIEIYYNIYQLLSEPDEEIYFTRCKELLKVNATRFSKSEAKEMYTFAQNYCIRKVNAGNRIYYAELFEVFKDVIASGTIYIDNEISPFDFDNIVIVGCNLKEFNWVEKFIEQNASFIPIKYRENSYNYNMALLYWFQKDYSKVLRILSRVDFDDPFKKTGAKTIMLKIYFEQREHDLLISQCESFRIYLKRNKLISDSHRRNHLNLIKFTSRLIKIGNGQYERLEKIKQEIGATKEVNNKAWLLEQIVLMEKEII